MLENEYYKNKYRIDSARLLHWDYGADGYYFVTICAKGGVHYFGEVINGKMNLNKIGYIVKKYFREIPRHYKHMKLDSFIIMPNHIHGILKIINKPAARNRAVGLPGNTNNRVETHNCASLRRQNGCDENQTRDCALLPLYKNQFGPQSKNLAAAIRAFKSSVKKFANQNNFEFQWQARFYDHIIKDETALFNIRDYIKTNPEKWERDRNNPRQLFI